MLFLLLTLFLLDTGAIQEMNIQASLGNSYASSSYSDAENELKRWGYVALVSLGWQILGMYSAFLLGVAAFWNRVNSFQTTMNFVGTVLLFFFMIQEWEYQYYKDIVICFNIIPFAFETVVIVSAFQE